MNVYEINGYWIAAPCKMDAYYIFLNEEDNLEYPFKDEDDLDENDEDSFTITIRRITSQELNKKDIPCCNDGCEDCQENDNTYYSLQDLLDSKDNLKCVLAKEED
jgi:hypothetical protein